jgi:hypothetical protein
MGPFNNEGENSESLKIEAYHEKSGFAIVLEFSWLLGFYREYWSCY